MAPEVGEPDAWRPPVAEQKSKISLKADLLGELSCRASPPTTLFTKGFKLIR